MGMIRVTMVTMFFELFAYLLSAPDPQSRYQA